MSSTCIRVAIATFPILTTGVGCQSTLSPCDITEHDCQEDVYTHLLSLRGDGYDPFNGMPRVTVISEDQFRQELVAQRQSTAPSPLDEALLLLHITSPTPAAAPNNGDAGVNGESTDDAGSYINDEATHIQAYYSSGAKIVTIVSHPTQTSVNDETNAMITLAHEFVHALQDREFDFSNDNYASMDGGFAHETFIEGDARFYELLFASDLLKLGYTQSNIVAVLDRYLAESYANLSQLGSSLFAAQGLTYFFGARFEAVAYNSGGNAAVRHAYANEPQHTVGFLVGPDGAMPSGRLGDDCVAPEASLPSAGATVDMDQFGALLFYAFLRGWGVDHTTAFPTAQGWLGDSVRVQATDDGRTTAVAWRIELSAAPPDAITQALSVGGALTVSSAGNVLEIATSNAETPLDWVPITGCP